ncbi:aldehyde ferredoxin oxidoreductase family protein [Chloroflexota bacterium]
MSKDIPGGYNGRILRVNLTDKTTTIENIDGAFCRKYIGGAGFVLHYLLQELKPGVDPLGPDNKLIFALGPVTGAALPGSGRHCIGGKSPLTGGLAKSEVGEFWGAELKRAGYDAVIVEGKAKQPVYLWIHDGAASIRDASHLWGQETKETQEKIRNELGDSQIRVALIGPGGENLVKYACIMHGLYDAAGRGGLGAVMGSKNLKAVAVRGNTAPKIADPARLKETRQWMLNNMQLMTAFTNGTGAAMQAFEAAGNLPVRNFRDGLFPGVVKIDTQAINNSIGIGMEGCFSCSVRCKKIVKVDQPYPVDPAYGGPEYETLASLGSNCGIDDLKAIARGNQLCGAYTLDTISTGGVIAFAMECFERGLLTIKDTGGIDLTFGNSDAMLKVIELIARREGIGNLLADGVAKAAEKIGKRSQDFALHVKNLEPGMHEPRWRYGFGLGFMVNPHGADHSFSVFDNMHTTPGGIEEFKSLGIREPLPTDDISTRKVDLLRIVHCKRIIVDSLAICQFFPYRLSQLAEITKAVTGWDTSVTELLKTGERLLNMARQFIIREGFTADDDKLPKRFYQPKTDGALSKKGLDPADMEEARRYYYTVMGWDKDTGIPLPEKLEELGIS